MLNSLRPSSQQIRYILLSVNHWKYLLDRSRKKIFKSISSSFKLAPPRVQVLDFANRQRDEYVDSELERSEFDK